MTVELIKAKNDQERNDDWVACDRCEKWQHYICGLYNKERDQGEGEYICSKCRLTEIEEGNWAPQTVLAAKDLPSTNLSDHIEQRLVTRMKQEREETAKFRGTELKNVACSEEKSSCTLSSQFTLFTIILFELINAGTVIAALIYMFANHAMRLKVDALLDALVHAFGCKNKNIECTYPCCQNIKKLLLHDSTCRIPRCMKTKKQRIKVTASSSEISKKGNAQRVSSEGLRHEDPISVLFTSTSWRSGNINSEIFVQVID
ncbi:histone acetyltransferase HAC1-like protein isoform X3 [Tanacetum coccineum]